MVELSAQQQRGEEEEARERMLHEQAKIQQHYKRLVQQRQETEKGGGGMGPPPPPPPYPGERSEEVYSGEANLPASLAAARPGSRTGITGTPSDPRFANFEEIQRHLSRRPAQYHSQVSGDRLLAGFRIRIHFFRIRIQRLRLETNPDPGL
jgi:hypothetical protein